MKFLESVAEYILEKHAEDLYKICLVFPNRRSGSFFTSYLQDRLSKTIVSPRIATINEVLHGFSNKEQADKLKLVSILYEVFVKHSKTKESFDDFYYWGEILLADFNDVDKYLVDPVDLFRNIADLKEVDYDFSYLEEGQKEVLRKFWGSLGKWDEYKNKEEFLKTWKLLLPVYSDFKARLKQLGLAFDGMVLRELANRVENGGDIDTPFDTYYFIGLNALNKCEKKFLNFLKFNKKASFFWDYDIAYLKDEKQEAGLFLRENISKFPSPGDFVFTDNAFNAEKNIEFIAVPTSQGQSQVVPMALKSLKDKFEKKFDNTAIVLADESLLFPVLGAIPESVDSVNITMGYPIRNSSIFGLVSIIASLLKNTKTTQAGITRFYYPYVFDILNHQLLAGIESDKVKDFIANAKRDNRIYIEQEHLYFSTFHTLIFQMPLENESIADYLLKIIRNLHQHLEKEQLGGDLMKEILVVIYQAIEQIGLTILDVENQTKQTISTAIFLRLLFQHLSQLSVSYEGEPLKGLQVMGILETRLLDFDNVVVLGLNEDYWPKSSNSPSFIPQNLRYAFGLPSIDQKDALYAYYFYRLIQRANNVTATFSTVKESLNRGELSRFGFQLIYDSSHEITQKNIGFQFKSNKEKRLVVKGSSSLSKRMLQLYEEKPLSPSALNIYLTCKYRYYLRYIVGLPDKDEIKEEVDGQMFGNIFHTSVEYLYEEIVGNEASPEWFQKKIKDTKFIDRIIRQAITEEYFKKDAYEIENLELEGNVRLIYEYIKTYIKQLLKVDAGFAPLTIESCENDYSGEIEFESNGAKNKILIGGKIDRLDRVNGQIRIIDYKTGNVKTLGFYDLKDVFDSEQKDPKKEIFQALYYSYIIKSYYLGNDAISAGVYDLKQLFSDKFDPLIKYNRKPLLFNSMVETYELELKGLLSEMFSADNEFGQTEYQDHCRQCPYKSICHR